MSIWDDPALALPAGEFVKFEKVGDTISGTVTGTRIGTNFAGGPCPQLDILTETGESKTLTAGQTKIHQLVVQHDVQVGDHITATYSREVPLTGGRTMKDFTVDVVKGGKETVNAANARLGNMAGGAPAAADSDAPPF